MSGHADDWHHHTAAEGVPQPEHAATVNARVLVITFIGIVFGVVLLVLLIVAYFNTYTSTYKAQRSEGVPDARSTYMTGRLGAEERLGKVGYVDRENGVVHVPLDRAVERVVTEYEGVDRPISSAGAPQARTDGEAPVADGG